MRVIICDRCGRRMEKGNYIGHLNAWFEDLKEIERATPEWRGWDYCPTCMEEIDSFIRTAPAEEESDEDGPDDQAESADAEPEAEPMDESLGETSDEVEDKAKEAPEGAPKDRPKRGGHPNSGRKPSVDWPKFKACVDAGKDNHWLAVEFSVDEKRITKWRWTLKEMIRNGKIK